MDNFEVHWVLDRDYLEICYDSVDNEMTQALTKLGVTFHVVHWRNRLFTEGFDTSSDSENVVYGVVGSVAFCRNISNILSSKVDMQRLIALFPDEVKHYSSYSYMVKPTLRLNQSGFMLSLGEIKSQGVESIKALTGYPDGVFMKCDFGLKSAESEFVLWDALDAWLDYTIKNTGCSLKSNFWLFSGQKIEKEFRFAVVDGVIVSGCQYMDFAIGLDSNTPTLSKDVPTEALDAAKVIAEGVNVTDNAYILDIAQTSTGFFMVECNAISSSGWYCMDHELLFEKLNKKMLQLAKEFLDTMNDFMADV